MSWDKYSGFFDKLSQEERDVLIKSLVSTRQQLSPQEDKIAGNLLHYLGWNKKYKSPEQKASVLSNVIDIFHKLIGSDRWKTMKPK